VHEVVEKHEWRAQKRSKHVYKQHGKYICMAAAAALGHIIAAVLRCQLGRFVGRSALALLVALAARAALTPLGLAAAMIE
jgi:hypothetical protein